MTIYFWIRFFCMALVYTPLVMFNQADFSFWLRVMVICRATGTALVCYAEGFRDGKGRGI